jgi:hypothetical protein
MSTIRERKSKNGDPRADSSGNLFQRAMTSGKDLELVRITGSLRGISLRCTSTLFVQDDVKTFVHWSVQLCAPFIGILVGLLGITGSPGYVMYVPPF